MPPHIASIKSNSLTNSYLDYPSACGGRNPTLQELQFFACLGSRMAAAVTIRLGLGRFVNLVAARRSTRHDVGFATKHCYNKSGVSRRLQTIVHQVSRDQFPAAKELRNYYVNAAAIIAAKAGKPLPDGSVLFAEVYSAKLDANNNPVAGADGFYIPDKLVRYTASSGWM